MVHSLSHSARLWRVLLLAVALGLSPALAFAQEATPTPEPEPDTLLTYLRDHASVVSGVAGANGETAEFVSLSIQDDFEIKPRLRGTIGLAAFGRQRITDEGSKIAPGVPTSLDDLALYSSGEAMLGAYFEWTPKVGIECRGGLVFEMVGLTGKRGEPVDGSKFLGACGLRLTGSPGHVSILGGHYGPIVEGAEVWFLPSLIVSGEFALPKNTSLVVDIQAGRDRITQEAVTYKRLAIRKGF